MLSSMSTSQIHAQFQSITAHNIDSIKGNLNLQLQCIFQ